MDLDKAIAFAEQCQVGYLATACDNRPFVRPLQMVTTGGEGFYFVTHPHKDVSKHLRGNPNVEICFNQNLRMLRVSGAVTWIDDSAWIVTSMAEQPWAPRGEIIAAIRPEFRFFALRSGLIRWWEDASKPASAELLFENGMTIGDACSR